jgi:chaperonin GroES
MSEASDIGFKPLGDRVLVERAKAAEKHGLIHVPEQAKEKPAEGVVLAVGPGKRAEDGKVLEPYVKVGDRILFGKYSGTEIKVDGRECVVMAEGDILGIVTARPAEATTRIPDTHDCAPA